MRQLSAVNCLVGLPFFEGANESKTVAVSIQLRVQDEALPGFSSMLLKQHPMSDIAFPLRSVRDVLIH